MKSGYVVAGNQKSGRLMHVGGEQYVGERMVKGGRFQSRKFSGRRAAVLLDWHAWQEETADQAYIRCRRQQLGEMVRQEAAEAKIQILKDKAPMKEVEQVTANAQQPKQGQKRRNTEQHFMYLLAFQQQRTTKGVAVYERMEDAIDMSDALTVALDATGMEGKYIVEELPIWGTKDRS